MYIASKSQKRSSNHTRFFGADVTFFRQTGCKLPNSGKNGGNSAKKQFANQINFHLYHYAGNNPVRYVDPDGRESADEIQSQIKTLQIEIADYMNKTGSQTPTENQMSMMMELMSSYNNATINEGNLNINDYVKNGVLTTDFEETQNAVGDYQVNLHSGVDIIGGDLISPFYMIAVNGNESGSNGKVFSIIGTDMRMNVLHGDAGSLSKSQDFFKPGDKVMPFPSRNNFQTASTGPHFHIELASGGKYVNPFTLKTSDSVFKRTKTGGKTWDIIKPNF